MVSQEFKNALKIYPIPKYKLAWKIGITPNILNHLLHEHIRVQPGDERLLKIARLIQFPEDKVFVKERIDA
jgi:hypothetical protein